MKKYRVLIWFPGKYDYYDGLFKSLNIREDVECKDKSDFGFEVDYYSQNDYEKVQAIFHANIIILYQLSKNELYIDISDDIIVWSYLDDIFGKYVMVGKDFFKDFPVNNYMYLPLLDVKAFDLDGVMKSEELRRKAIVAPFVPLENSCDMELADDEKQKFSSDIVIITYKKRIGDNNFKYMSAINEDNASSKDVMQVLGFLYPILHKEIMDREHIITDMGWIERTLVKIFDKTDIWQYVRNKDIFLERWKRLVFYVANAQLYGNIIVDWLIEKDYNLKLWGGWDEKKYSKYSMGYLQDGSAEMYYANKMSKIGINSNPFGALHRRSFSCINSGTMCMSAAFDTEENDAKYSFSHYSHFFENEKSIVVFHNKKELLNYIDYYLTHEKEREQIALMGKRVVDKQKLNYINVVNKAFEELITRIGENGKTII